MKQFYFYRTFYRRFYRTFYTECSIEKKTGKILSNFRTIFYRASMAFYRTFCRRLYRTFCRRFYRTFYRREGSIESHRELNRKWSESLIEFCQFLFYRILEVFIQKLNFYRNCCIQKSKSYAFNRIL